MIKGFERELMLFHLISLSTRSGLCRVVIERHQHFKGCFKLHQLMLKGIHTAISYCCASAQTWFWVYLDNQTWKVIFPNLIQATYKCGLKRDSKWIFRDAFQSGWSDCSRFCRCIIYIFCIICKDIQVGAYHLQPVMQAVCQEDTILIVKNQKIAFEPCCPQPQDQIEKFKVTGAFELFVLFFLPHSFLLLLFLGSFSHLCHELKLHQCWCVT